MLGLVQVTPICVTFGWICQRLKKLPWNVEKMRRLGHEWLREQGRGGGDAEALHRD
jgi:hypothetical protein